MSGFWHWLIYFIGVRPRTPAGAYNFWSGFGSDIGEVAIIGGLIQIARHANCHVQGCWRFGHHQVAGGQYKVCKVHHPDIDHTEKVTAETVEAAHVAHLVRQAGARPTRAVKKTAAAK